MTQPEGGKIGLFWPFMFHLLNSIGFAHILPISLALFTKIAPKQITATVIGLYYLAFFAANKSGRLRRRAIFLAADDDLLADPHRQRGFRARRVRSVQDRARQADGRQRRAGAGRCADLDGRLKAVTHRRLHRARRAGRDIVITVRGREIMRAEQILDIDLGLRARRQLVEERRVDPRIAGQLHRIADRRIGFRAGDQAQPDADALVKS